MGRRIHKFLNSLKLTDEEDEYLDEEEFDEPVVKTAEIKKEKNKPEPAPLLRRYEQFDEEEEEVPTPAFEQKKPFSKPSPFIKSSVQNHKKVELRSEFGEKKVFALMPDDFEDSKLVCDTLRAGGAVFMNFERVDLELAQRLMDFACGVVYSLDGKIYQLSGYTFLISPKDYDIEGDFLAMIGGENFEIPTFVRGE